MDLLRSRSVERSHRAVSDSAISWVTQMAHPLVMCNVMFVTEVPGARQYSLPHTYTENLHARVLTDFRDSSNRHLRRRSFAEIRPDHRSRAERVGGWNPGLKKRRLPYTMPALWRKNAPADSMLLLCLTNHKVVWYVLDLRRISDPCHFFHSVIYRTFPKGH